MKKILIIDDEVNAIAVLELLLGKSPYEIYSTTDSVNAVTMMSKLMPDLILLDWIMPNRDGPEVFKQMQEFPALTDIPVIIVTGVRTGFDDLKRALNAGARDYLKKPVNGLELEARIASAFRHVEDKRKIMELQQLNMEIMETKAEFLQMELEKKEREMAVTAVSIFQNKQFLASLRKDLLNPEISYEKNSQQHIIQVMNKYDNISNSMNWKLFEKRFIEIHTTFYKKMQTEHEGLSWGELRLCALLRMGFSIKEISVLCYSNYDAIRKAVYRIRKKLKIDERKDITIFLQQY